MVRGPFFFFFLLFLVFPASALSGQGKIRVVTTGIQPSTVKLGNAARIVITVKGARDAKLLPLPKVDGLELEAGPASERTFISFDGFRQVREVSLSFVITVTPSRKGTFQIPPIKVKAGGAVWATGKETLEVVEDFLGRQFGYLDVKVSARQVFVHQPFRVDAVFGVRSDIVGNVQEGLSLRLPWWEKLPGTVLLGGGEDLGGKRQQVYLNGKVVSAAGLGFKAIGGKRFLLFRLTRRFLPTESGRLTLGAGFLRFKLALSYTRDLFGQRIPKDVEACTVPGKPLAVEVKPLPEKGRPTDFSGAVGRFRLSAQASPRRVRVGDSVKVTLTIRGRGNLGFFRAPELDGLDGFRCYGKTEEKDGDTLKVVYDLVPVRADVKAVPPIAFDYFDTSPGEEGYKTVRTRPIPLEVLPLPPGRHLAPLPGTRPALRPGVDDIVDIKVFDPEEGMTPPDETGGAGTLILLFLPPLAWLLFFLFWKARLRSRADPATLRRKRALGELKGALREAKDPDALGRAFETFLGDLWGVGAAAVQGGGWRTPAREWNVPPGLTERIEAVEEELDRARFAPAGEWEGERAAGEILALAGELSAWMERRKSS